MQHQGARSRRHNGVVNAKATLDLIIVDVLEDLPVPTMSEPADVVPPWNQSADSLLEAAFVFAKDYLQDDGAMIVIHPFQVDAKSTILGYCVEYGFETRKEWHEPPPSLFTSEQNLDYKFFTKVLIFH
jgi:hypothetical protein